MSDKVARMVRNTPRKRDSWRRHTWVWWHNRHGQVIRKTLAIQQQRPDGLYLSTRMIEVCGRGHARGVR